MYEDIDWTKAILMYDGIIRNIIVACETKHEHYVPTMSAFKAYAQALEELLPVLKSRADTILMEKK